MSNDEQHPPGEEARRKVADWLASEDPAWLRLFEALAERQRASESS